MKVEGRYGVVKEDGEKPGESHWVVVAEFISFPNEAAAKLAAAMLAKATAALFTAAQPKKELLNSTASTGNGLLKH